MSVRLDKVQATYNGNIEVVITNVDLKNGSVITIGGLVDGHREAVVGATPTDVTIDEILLVASPEIVYDSRKHNIHDFINVKNEKLRSYHHTIGDIVTVTDDMVEGTSVKNQYLIPVNGSSKLKPAADLSGNTRFAAKVLEKVKLYGEPATRYKVVKV